MQFLNRHGVHCETLGPPEPGRSWFCCDDCLAFLEELLKEKANRAHGRTAVPVLRAKNVAIDLGTEDASGIGFYSQARRQKMRYLYPDSGHHWAGWIIFRNADGQWVSLLFVGSIPTRTSIVSLILALRT